ncbi:unnamed protein product [Bursaphelenchus xylophilus]|uniref:microtubule-severing ATPase n=1 Tax=Bursaphelenchus xylophilus TaxID=6326 RepID=A0A1I7RRT4_BURXY|nr:unnamed protein product [Bursaphelenchus xylophilus]CAG9123489.1 unnamed protein product [Bursaphelenchus xylophilus]
MASIAPDVLEANYERFRKLLYESRLSLNKAISADEGSLNTKRQVLMLYKKAIRDIQQACSISSQRCPQNKRAEVEKDRATLMKHLTLTQERINDLTTYLKMDVEETVKPKVMSTLGSTPSTSKESNVPKKKLLVKNVDPKLAEELSGSVIDTTGVRMEDILGNETAKAALEETVILPNLNPGLFTGLREPCKGILLFGPPGNGKTMLAKAVATESNCTFFNISAASIMSKWVGEGERLMQALFSMARNAQPSIIFIDEIDSLLCSRQENENGASRRVKTEFLLQFDGCVSKAEDRVLVLGATNRPQELDDGVLRRFPKRIYIDLPDEYARSQLIRKIFEKNKTKFCLSTTEIRDIARLSKGYSYSDMTALCKEAAMAPLRGLSRQQLQKISATNVRPVNYADLREATAVIRASSNEENTKKLMEFARKFAQHK